ncbi:MAG: helical membrane plugin domain-containing protein [Acidiferrobacteraceae bacterium]
MARRLDCEVSLPRTEPSVEQELHELLVVLSERGILRALRDFVGGLPGISLILARALNQPETAGAVQNLALLLKGLGSLPPEGLERLLASMKAAVSCLEATDDSLNGKDAAPGVRGAYRLLQDDDLWRAIDPVLEGLRVFGATLRSTKNGRPAAKTNDPLL